MDDEDDAASVAIAPGGTRPVVRASQESTMMSNNKNSLPAFTLSSNNPIQNDAFGTDEQNNGNNGTFGGGMMPPTSSHYHQRTILNYMAEKVFFLFIYYHSEIKTKNHNCEKLKPKFNIKFSRFRLLRFLIDQNNFY